MKTYYQKHAHLNYLRNKKIVIIGYGIQGRAQALNLRDSGCEVVVGNIKDDYYKQAKKDGFPVTGIKEAVQKGSIIFLLIPDQAQKQVYENDIAPFLKKGSMLVFAHGYSIHFKQIVPPKNIDICLLAPRMPGGPIREHYLKGGGIPAFIAVHQDASRKAKRILLALCKALGFTKAGVMELSFKEEVEIDLFIEHFLLPSIIRSIRLSFDTLVEEGFTPESTLMELYASGEIGELFMMAAKTGIYRVWKNNASPTCQYGIFRNSEYIMPEKETKKKIKKVLKEIRNGSFINDLSKEAKLNYRNLKKYDQLNEKSLLTKTQDKLGKLIVSK